MSRGWKNSEALILIKPRLSLREIGRNMNVKGASGEDLEGNDEHIIEH